MPGSQRIRVLLSERMKEGKKEASDEADIRVEKSEGSKEDENTSCLTYKTAVTTVVTVVVPNLWHSRVLRQRLSY